METDGDRFRLLTVLLVLFCVLRGWFSACEAALTELPDAAIRDKAESDPKYRRLNALISKSGRLRRTFLIHRVFTSLWIGILCFGIYGTAFAALIPLHDALLLTGLLFAVILTLLMTVFTDTVPRQLALHASESFALRCAPTVRALLLLWTPFRAAVSTAAALLCRVFGVSSAESTGVVTEEEIRQLVDAGNETGGIEESQREMINNIFTFDDVSVSDVMTHRREISAVPDTATAFETARLAMEMGYSRIPVYAGSVDSVVGVVLVKDLLPLVGESTDRPVTELMRGAIFVPDTAKCGDVFQQMRKAKMQLAIVADEYGGTAGMVTMEDLLEEIVGSIEDEYDDEEAELTVLGEGVYSIAGSADPEDILPQLGVRMERDDAYDTMSAFVVHLLGRIPQENERPVVEHDGVRYTLLSYEDNWISRIRAEVLTPAAAEAEV